MLWDVIHDAQTVLLVRTFTCKISSAVPHCTSSYHYLSVTYFKTNLASNTVSLKSYNSICSATNHISSHSKFPVLIYAPKSLAKFGDLMYLPRLLSGPSLRNVGPSLWIVVPFDKCHLVLQNRVVGSFEKCMKASNSLRTQRDQQRKDCGLESYWEHNDDITANMSFWMENSSLVESHPFMLHSLKWVSN